MRYMRKTSVGMIGIILEGGSAMIVDFGMSQPFPGTYETPEEVVTVYNQQIADNEANHRKASQCNCHAESHDDWEKPLTY
jgi:hypothetical protein